MGSERTGDYSSPSRNNASSTIAAVTVAEANMSPVVAATTAGGSAAVLSAWRRSRSAGCGGGMYRSCRVIPPFSAMHPSKGGDEGVSGGS